MFVTYYLRVNNAVWNDIAVHVHDALRYTLYSRVMRAVVLPGTPA